jgi:hypothetical protein
MLLSVPFVLVGILRYQLLSNPEEVERREELDIFTEQPEDNSPGDKGIQLTFIG